MSEAEDNTKQSSQSPAELRRNFRNQLLVPIGERTSRTLNQHFLADSRLLVDSHLLEDSNGTVPQRETMADNSDSALTSRGTVNTMATAKGKSVSFNLPVEQERRQLSKQRRASDSHEVDDRRILMAPGKRSTCETGVFNMDFARKGRESMVDSDDDDHEAVVVKPENYAASMNMGKQKKPPALTILKKKAESVTDKKVAALSDITNDKPTTPTKADGDWLLLSDNESSPTPSKPSRGSIALPNPMAMIAAMVFPGPDRDYMRQVIEAERENKERDDAKRADDLIEEEVGLSGTDEETPVLLKSEADGVHPSELNLRGGAVDDDGDCEPTDYRGYGRYTYHKGERKRKLATRAYSRSVRIYKGLQEQAHDVAFGDKSDLRSASYASRLNCHRLRLRRQRLLNVNQKRKLIAAAYKSVGTVSDGGFSETTVPLPEWDDEICSLLQDEGFLDYSNKEYGPKLTPDHSAHGHPIHHNSQFQSPIDDQQTGLQDKSIITLDDFAQRGMDIDDFDNHTESEHPEYTAEMLQQDAEDDEDAYETFGKVLGDLSKKHYSSDESLITLYDNSQITLHDFVQRGIELFGFDTESGLPELTLDWLQQVAEEYHDSRKVRSCAPSPAASIETVGERQSEPDIFNKEEAETFLRFMARRKVARSSSQSSVEESSNPMHNKDGGDDHAHQASPTEGQSVIHGSETSASPLPSSFCRSFWEGSESCFDINDAYNDEFWSTPPSPPGSPCLRAASFPEPSGREPTALRGGGAGPEFQIEHGATRCVNNKHDEEQFDWAEPANRIDLAYRFGGHDLYQNPSTGILAASLDETNECEPEGLVVEWADWEWKGDYGYFYNAFYVADHRHLEDLATRCFDEKDPVDAHSKGSHEEKTFPEDSMVSFRRLTADILVHNWMERINPMLGPCDDEVLLAEALAKRILFNEHQMVIPDNASTHMNLRGGGDDVEEATCSPEVSSDEDAAGDELCPLLSPLSFKDARRQQLAKRGRLQTRKEQFLSRWNDVQSRNNRRHVRRARRNPNIVHQYSRILYGSRNAAISRLASRRAEISRKKALKAAFQVSGSTSIRHELNPSSSIYESDGTGDATFNRETYLGGLPWTRRRLPSDGLSYPRILDALSEVVSWFVEPAPFSEWLEAFAKVEFVLKDEPAPTPPVDDGQMASSSSVSSPDMPGLEDMVAIDPDQLGRIRRKYAVENGSGDGVEVVVGATESDLTESIAELSASFATIINLTSAVAGQEEAAENLTPATAGEEQQPATPLQPADEPLAAVAEPEAARANSTIATDLESSDGEISSSLLPPDMLEVEIPHVPAVAAPENVGEELTTASDPGDLRDVVSQLPSDERQAIRRTTSEFIKRPNGEEKRARVKRWRRSVESTSSLPNVPEDAVEAVQESSGNNEDAGEVEGADDGGNNSVV